MKDNVQRSEHLAAARRRLKVDLLALGAARWLDLLALAVPFVVAPDRVIAAVQRLRAVLAGRNAPGTADGPAAPLRFIEEAIARIEQALRWTADVVAGDSAPWARPTVNLAVALLLLSLALFGWRRLQLALWRAWSAARNERALRGPGKLDGLPEPVQIETRLFAALSTALANTAMAATLLMALGVSVVWSFAPASMTEAGIYRLLGQTAALLFAILLLFSQVTERSKDFVALQKRWRRWRSARSDMS